MEGVTILSTGTAIVGISWGAAIIIALIASLVIYLINPLEADFGWRICCAAYIFILSFITLAIVSVDTTEVTEYKVTIDDSVKYVEFMEKYEVIDQEGEIYTVRERIKE
jgi:MFS family permease